MRKWQHRHDDVLQAVDVLGWTQHGAIVIATEPGWLPTDEPAFVRISELVLT